MDMLRLDRRLRGGMKLVVLGAVAAIAAASVASSHTASAAVLAPCSGLGAVSGATDITYGTCGTDQNDGAGSVAFSTDGRSMTLATSTKRGAEQVAGYWQTSGPIAVTATRICLGVNVTALKRTRDGAFEQQLIVSYGGVQQDPRTWSVTKPGIQPAYCASVPADATNVWWQLISLAGGSKTHVSETLVTVVYSNS